MNRLIKTVTPVVLAAFVLGACNTTDRGSKETIGGITGAVLGGVLGSQVGKGKGQLVAVGAGAILGGLLGSSIGKSLDDVDRMKANQATQSSLETSRDGAATSWSNPNSGNSGQVEPTRTYYDEGRPCREFTQTIMVGGQEETAYGTACRDADGNWRIKS